MNNRRRSSRSEPVWLRTWDYLTLERFCNLAIVFFSLIATALLWLAFLNHRSAIDWAFKLSVLLKPAPGSPDAQVKLEAARVALDAARAQYFSSDTITFLFTFLNILVLTLAIKAYARADEQVRRIQLISRRIHPLVGAGAIYQSIWASLATASQHAKNLTLSTGQQASIASCLTGLREQLRDVGKSLNGAVAKELGVHPMVLDRFRDSIGEIETALRAMAKAVDPAASPENQALSAELSQLLDLLDDCRVALKDDLSKRWADLAAKLDDVC